jgi:hypothetical protein
MTNSERNSQAAPAVTLTLGRDGMGAEADEADFDAWCAYVSARIDEASGCDVTVDERGARDVQEDAIRCTRHLTAGGTSYHAEDAVRDALITMWEEFCADTSAWPERGAA